MGAMNQLNFKSSIPLLAVNLSTEVMRVTPHIAAEMLKGNGRNRPLSESTVSVYAGAMRRGEWVLNCEPIIFSEDGELNDGQHRLHAVVRSGVAIDLLVVRGASRESFKTIGQGKRRGPSDALAIDGEVNTSALAAGARAYIQYSTTGRAAYEITTPQIIQTVRDHPELRYWTRCYAGAKPMTRFPSLIIGLLTVASEKYGTSKLDTLFEKLASGVGLSEGDPALVLRERFTRIAGMRHSVNLAQAKGFIIKTINAHILGKKITMLRISHDEAAPRIV